MMFYMIYFACAGLLAMTSSAVTPVQLTKADVKGFLTAHNAARAAVGVQGLVWNVSLSVSAGRYGAQCIWEHSGGKYGENLYASSPARSNHTLVAIAAVNDWVSEKKFVDRTWKCMSGSPTCGHYTQVVWRKTISVGCGINHCTGIMSNYVICQYWPSGNVIGWKPY